MSSSGIPALGIFPLFGKKTKEKLVFESFLNENGLDVHVFKGHSIGMTDQSL